MKLANQRDPATVESREQAFTHAVLPDELFDQAPIAQILLVKEKTMETWRSRGGGPKYIKIGRLVRYRLSDVQAFIDAGARASTSE